MSKLWDMWLNDLRQPIPQQTRQTKETKQPRKRRKKARSSKRIPTLR